MGPTTGRKEALPIALGVGLGFRLALSQMIDGRVGQAEHNSPNGSKHTRGIGIAHAAKVLLHRHIQAVVQPAFDHPVAPLELKHALGVELIQREAADQVDDFVAPFAFAQHAGVEPRDQTRSREAGLAGRDFDQFKDTDFGAPAVLLLDTDLGARAALRGKNPVRRTGSAKFFGVPAGCL